MPQLYTIKNKTRRLSDSTSKDSETQTITVLNNIIIFLSCYNKNNKNLLRVRSHVVFDTFNDDIISKVEWEKAITLATIGDFSAVSKILSIKKSQRIYSITFENYESYEHTF